MDLDPTHAAGCACAFFGDSRGVTLRVTRVFESALLFSVGPFAAFSIKNKRPLRHSLPCEETHHDLNRSPMPMKFLVNKESSSAAYMDTCLQIACSFTEFHAFASHTQGLYCRESMIFRPSDVFPHPLHPTSLASDINPKTKKKRFGPQTNASECA